MKLQGKVLNWNDDKGYGFVEPNGGGERAFVHVKAFQPGSRRPINGDVIVYELVYDNNNRYKAENIKFSSVHASTTNTNKKYTSIPNIKPKKQSRIDPSFVFFVIFWILLGGSVVIEKLPSNIIGLFVLLSTITFITYWIDKSAAKNNRWRTSEATLHFLSLLGGWPGAYLAQNILRHKSIKKSFKNVFGLTVVLNLCGLVWLHTEQGAALLTVIF